MGDRFQTTNKAIIDSAINLSYLRSKCAKIDSNEAECIELDAANQGQTKTTQEEENDI